MGSEPVQLPGLAADKRRASRRGPLAGFAAALLIANAYIAVQAAQPRSAATRSIASVRDAPAGAAIGETPANADGRSGIFRNLPAKTRALLSATKAATAHHAMVSTAQHLATMVGLRILKQGGNAIDAAVAIGYAEAVVNPCCGNIGGGGFMTIHLDHGKNVFLNFREKAPLKATTDMFLHASGTVAEKRSLFTYKAIGVPGTVMGLNTALHKYGTMSLKQVMAPAIKLARDGFILTRGDTAAGQGQGLHGHTKEFRVHPNAAAIFLDHGKPWQPGQTLVQKNLAHSLQLIAANGTKAFYDGAIARAIVKASKKHGGLFTMKDFTHYTVTWEKPISCHYHGFTIVSAPPPSSGGVTLCMILNILKPYPLRKWGFGSVKTLHYEAEAMRRAFANRNTYLGDPAFIRNPIKRLLSDTVANKLRATINPAQATPSAQISGVLGPYSPDKNTTQYSVVDAHGNAVSVTYTINYLYGSGFIAGNTGFFLNDEMNDFTEKPGVANGAGLVQGVADEVKPGKRPLSSMTPTIVLRHHKVVMVTGSPGSATIITTTLHTILNVVDFGMNMQQAVSAPRLHQQWLPDTIYVEPGLLTQNNRKALLNMGYHITSESGIGVAESVLVDPSTGLLEGASDPRRAGSLSAGY